jgi:O-acetyl-ADP-ribose deacetylase (regulator of RNase III)
MKQVQGDLLGMAMGGEFTHIMHGCNCFNTMGGGIARTIKLMFPEAYEADCETVSGDKSKLGLFTVADVARDEKGQLVQFTIINAYTQYDTSGWKDVFEYEAFEHALRLFNRKYPGAKLGMPEIGMGLAGGDRDRIYGIIERVSNELGMDITVVVYKPER